MSKQGYEPAASAPLPTAPPPPYESIVQPPYNPVMQPAISQSYHYQPTPVIHETPQQGSHTPYPPQCHYPQPAPAPAPAPAPPIPENPVVVGVPLLVGPRPLRTTCPNCRASIQSRTIKQTKGIAHLFVLGLCLLGCCLCSCIPYCLESLKEVQHTCPKCKAYLGTYRQ